MRQSPSHIRLNKAQKRTIYGVFVLEGVMLRISVTAALVFLSTFASAQSLEEVKWVKFGVECLEPIKPIAARLGGCMVTSSTARIWCPNGKTFERVGALPQPAVLRSICGLNQIL
jgi:hypothetical protein